MRQIVWLALGYHVPVNPSKNRVYVWRKLKEYGAGYFKQGVAILPRSQQSYNQFSALAVKIREMGGEAVMTEMRFCNPADEQDTVRRFREQSRSEYLELMRDCANLTEAIRNNLFAPDVRSDRVKKMIRRISKVKSRDFFRSGPGTDMTRLLNELAGDIAHSAGELSRQLRNLLE